MTVSLEYCDLSVVRYHQLSGSAVLVLRHKTKTETVIVVTETKNKTVKILSQDTVSRWDFHPWCAIDHTHSVLRLYPWCIIDHTQCLETSSLVCNWPHTVSWDSHPWCEIDHTQCLETSSLVWNWPHTVSWDSHPSCAIDHTQKPMAVGL